MAKVLIPLAAGCEELEAVTIIDLMRRAQLEVVTASLTTDLAVKASRGVTLLADTTLDNVVVADFAMVVMPGGQPGTDNLNADSRVHQLLKSMAAADKWLAAICAAPLVLAHAGLLDGYRATAYPCALTTADWPQIQLCDDAVVTHGKRVTSRGPGTAMDFALTLIELLTDQVTHDKVAAGLVRS